MKRLLPLLAAALAFCMLPVSAFTQQEMLLRYEQAKLSVADMRRQCYQHGMFLRAEYIPRSGEGTVALALTPEGCRFVGGVPEGNPIRPDDDYHVRTYCLAEDGKRMGCLAIDVKGSGRFVRVVKASSPGDYVRESPLCFVERSSGARVRWRFEGEAFRSLSFDYGYAYFSGKVYGADGKLQAVSFIPSLYRGPTTLPFPRLKELELPTLEEPPPPVIDLSEVEGSLCPPEVDPLP